MKVNSSAIPAFITKKLHSTNQLILYFTTNNLLIKIRSKLSPKISLKCSKRIKRWIFSDHDYWKWRTRLKRREDDQVKHLIRAFQGTQFYVIAQNETLQIDWGETSFWYIIFCKFMQGFVSRLLHRMPLFNNSDRTFLQLIQSLPACLEMKYTLFL